jgi:HEAT repeat protein
MQLVSLLDGEQDMSVKGEFYRALGRIGTPDAIQALKKAADPGGLFKARVSGPRLAAVEGLSLAGQGAEAALRELEKDGDKEVRAVVTKALAGMKKR